MHTKEKEFLSYLFFRLVLLVHSQLKYKSHYFPGSILWVHSTRFTTDQPDTLGICKNSTYFSIQYPHQMENQILHWQTWPESWPTSDNDLDVIYSFTRTDAFFPHGGCLPGWSCLSQLPKIWIRSLISYRLLLLGSSWC